MAATGAGATYPVTVRLSEETGDVRPGMAAEVAIPFEEGDGRPRILVPPFAVGEDREGRFVYVAEREEGESAVVRRRAVRVGELSGEGIEILDGLQEGEPAS